jgi:hypothetical protein
MRLIIACLFLLNGCASHAVRCDAHLSPINAPAAKLQGEAMPAGSAP